MSLSPDEVKEIRAVIHDEEHKNEVPYFHSRKARTRCVYVLSLTLILAIGFRILHHELLLRGIDFALGSLIDFLLFGTVES